MGKPRGFAAMNPKLQRKIAAMGGRASHGGGRKPKPKEEDKDNA
jgi:hypothetical protein